MSEKRIMEDDVCVRFLQWLLPRLRMRYPGFRKVRKQVCKRIQRHIKQLKLTDAKEYQHYLQTHPDEWLIVDKLCRVTISRFYRDKVVLEHISKEVLPVLAQAAVTSGETIIRGWSAGCAAGEEAYSLVLMWDRLVSNYFPELDIQVIATDIDPVMLGHAISACYTYSSIKALPEEWIDIAFSQQEDVFCLDSRLRNKVTFNEQDIRQSLPTNVFHIIFCRNLAFTYFDNSLQLEVLENIRDCLVDGGALIIGGHESLPGGYSGFCQWPGQRAIFQKL
ncbi:MAG: chemotaxis protein CheR [Gammaproteobacteria bacterium]|nr:chemotaxis protein CheR [Gammaproteobacteria bacterium]